MILHASLLCFLLVEIMVLIEILLYQLADIVDEMENNKQYL